MTAAVPTISRSRNRRSHRRLGVHRLREPLRPCKPADECHRAHHRPTRTLTMAQRPSFTSQRTTANRHPTGLLAIESP
jgi:hypothetical protein